MSKNRLPTRFRNGLVVLSATVAAVPMARAQISFSPGLGGATPEVSAWDISADGRVVVGVSSFTGGYYWSRDAFRWEPPGAMVSLGPFPGAPDDLNLAILVAQDGSAIAGIGKGSFCPISACDHATVDDAQWNDLTSTMGGPTGCDYPPMPFRWTMPDPTLEPLPLVPGTCFGEVLGMSADGGVVVGYMGSFDGRKAFRWTSGGTLDLAPGSLSEWYRANAVSSDGTVVVGMFDGWAARWIEADGFVTEVLPSIGAETAEALALSADGTTAVGYSYDPSTPGFEHAVMWDASGMIMDLGARYLGFTNSRAVLVSDDGSVIVGWAADLNVAPYESQLFRYDNGIMTPLGALTACTASPEHCSQVIDGAYRVRSPVWISADGSVILGNGAIGPLLWETALGLRSVQDVLEIEYGFSLDGRVVEEVAGLSADGRTLAGTTIDPFGIREVFHAALGNTRPGTNVPVDLNGGATTSGGLTLTFDGVGSGGDTTAVATASCDAGFGANFQVFSPAICYDIDTTATPSGTITVCINYSGTPADTDTEAEKTLELRHYEPLSGCPADWCDRTVDASPGDPTTLVDTVNNIICAEVSSLSPFMIVERDSDADGLADAHELVLGTDPWDPDTDADGLFDGTEVDAAMGGACPDPLVVDSDGDTLLDGAEVSGGTDPCSWDSDGDGIADATDPLPTEPGVTSGWLEDALRALANEVIPSLGLDLFSAPNPNAQAGRRGALGNRAAAAANAIAAGDSTAAIAELASLLDKIDGVDPDWMNDSQPDAIDIDGDQNTTESAREALADYAQLLLGLL